MSNNILSAFAIVTVIGFSAALLPRLAAPSDSYINDALNPVDDTFVYPDVEPIYYTDSLYFRIVCPVDIDTTATYRWEYSTGLGSWYNVLSNSNFSASVNYGLLIIKIPASPASLYYFRCVRTFSNGDSDLYYFGYQFINLSSNGSKSLFIDDFERSIENDVSDLGTIPTIDNFKENDFNIETDIQEEKTE